MQHPKYDTPTQVALGGFTFVLSTLFMMLAGFTDPGAIPITDESAREWTIGSRNGT